MHCIVSLIPNSGIWCLVTFGDSDILCVEVWPVGEVGGETPIYTSSLEESSQEVQLGCLLCHSEFRM